MDGGSRGFVRCQSGRCRDRVIRYALFGSRPRKAPVTRCSLSRISRSRMWEWSQLGQPVASGVRLASPRSMCRLSIQSDGCPRRMFLSNSVSFPGDWRTPAIELGGVVGNVGIEVPWPSPRQPPIFPRGSPDQQWRGRIRTPGEVHLSLVFVQVSPRKAGEIPGIGRAPIPGGSRGPPRVTNDNPRAGIVSAPGDPGAFPGAFKF